MGTMRQRRLGRELRDLRETAGLSVADVLERLGWSRAKLDRIESGATTPKEADLVAALELYGARSGQKARLLDLRSEAKKRGWWTAYGDVFSGSYVALENDASLIRDWQPQLVPGLLQTEAYARAVISGARPGDSVDEVERRVQARMARRTLLGRPDAPQLHAIIDESVLHRQIGGQEVLRQQLSHLWDCMRRPNISVQVLRLTAGAHPGVDGAFIILSYADNFIPNVVCAEGPFGDIYPESATELARVDLAWRHLSEAALSAQASDGLIAELVNKEPR